MEPRLPQTIVLPSLDSLSTAHPIQIPAIFDPTTIPFKWSLLTPEQRVSFWEHYPLCRPILDSLYWLRHHTKTLDEQDPANPFKPFPNREYHQFLTDRWLEEAILLIEKSRTMMTSWWMAGVCTHYV